MAVAHRALGGGTRRARLALLAALAALAACSGRPPGVAAPGAAAPGAAAPGAAARLAAAPGAAAPSAPAPPTAPADPSYDWRRLVIVPFGTERQSMPAALHEVLFFRDDDDAGGKLDAEDCYTADSPAPRLVGRAADHYFLCFRNDRLDRIEAVVALPNEAASELFAQVCDAWLKDARPIVSSALLCAGQGGAAEFRARLEPAADGTETELSIAVDAAAAPD